MTSQPTAKDWVSLIVLAVIFGSSFMAVKIAIGEYSPMTLTACRLGLAAVILTAISYLRGSGLPDFRTQVGRVTWLYCLGLALFTSAIPFTLLNWAQIRVTSSFAGLTMAAVPLLILPLAHFLVEGEQLTRRKLAGFLVGFAGVAILIGPNSIFNSSGNDMEGLARFACLGAACCYATGSIIMRHSPHTSLVAFSAGGLLIGSFLTIPLALIFEDTPEFNLNGSFAAMVYLAVMPTSLATLLMVRIAKSAGPSFLGLVNYQVPVWAVIFGTVLLNESQPATFLGALALILFGIGISQYRSRAKTTV